jgi:acyl-coenzyme A thioesterase PaaI-like protein
MAGEDKLHRVITALGRLPQPLRSKALSLVMGKVVPYVGTSGLVIEEMNADRVIVIARDRRPYQNHIHSVHAAAMALAVETASGFVTVMNLPASKLPLIKTLKVDYVKRSRGDLRAVATISDAQRAEIRGADKGSIDVEVHATDATGEEPIRCQAVWAWVPRR